MSVDMNTLVKNVIAICARMILTGTLLTLLPLQVSAAECYVTNAKVRGIFQYQDGNTFVGFDQDSNCNCPIADRLAFNISENQDFIISAALVAFSTQVIVNATGEDTGCSVHGNTAKLIGFTLRR